MHSCGIKVRKREIERNAVAFECVCVVYTVYIYGIGIGVKNKYQNKWEIYHTAVDNVLRVGKMENKTMARNKMCSGMMYE